MKAPKPTRRDHREAAIQVLYAQSFAQPDLGKAAAGTVMSRLMDDFRSSAAQLREVQRAAGQAADTMDQVIDTIGELLKPAEARKKLKPVDSPQAVRVHLAQVRSQALKQLQQAARTLSETDQLFVEDGFCVRLLTTFEKHRDRVEAALARALEGWTLRRLTAEDGSVLRLGVTELLCLEDVPPRVAINEYIELSKLFGDAESTRLVNGVLDRVLRDNPRAEPS